MTDRVKQRKIRGIESLKSRYGLLFVSPWIIGFVLFFAIPLFQSVVYSFSTVVLTDKGMESSLTGFRHYFKLVMEDPTYTDSLLSSVATLVYSLPLILVVSLFLALILNQRFRGRLFFRVLYRQYVQRGRRDGLAKSAAADRRVCQKYYQQHL